MYPHVEAVIENNINNQKMGEVTYSNIQVVNKKSPTHIYSNINTYSNLPPYSSVDHNDILGRRVLQISIFVSSNFTVKALPLIADNLPPPPPEPVDYAPCRVTGFPPPPDDLPPPPSPVSSSYSELRRATQYPSPNYQQDYSNYGPSSRVTIKNITVVFCKVNRFIILDPHI